MDQQPIVRPKEQPFALLPDLPVDNQLNQQPGQDNCPQIPLNHPQKSSEENGDFQKQSLFPVHLQVQEPKLEPIQQLFPNPQIPESTPEMSQKNQTNVSPEPTATEQKQIIEILQEMDHDEETPVFGGPNPTQTLVQQTQNLTINEQKPALPQQLQQEHQQGEMIVVSAASIPIVLEDSQPQTELNTLEQQSQPVSPNPEPKIIIIEQPQQPQPQSQNLVDEKPSEVPTSSQKNPAQVQPSEVLISPQQPQQPLSLFPTPQAKPQQTQIVIESQSEQEIEVPQKAPQPGLVESMKLSAENIRKLLLEADSDWAEIIKNASQAEILQFYEELTNKIQINGNEQGENHGENHQQKLPGQQQQIIVQEITNSQDKPAAQLQQQPQPIIQEPQTLQNPTTIPQSQPPAAIPTSYPQTNISPLKPEQLMQFQMITAILSQSSPQLEEQIKRLSNEQLRALYRETMEQNKKKEQGKGKNKKKKTTHPVIDLEDDAADETAMNEEKVMDNPILADTQRSKAANQQILTFQQQASELSTFSFLTQYQKRKSQSQKTIPTQTAPIFVNKTLLYSLIKSHDYQDKLKSVLMPKQSIKYQEKTEKEMALLYMNHLRKNKIPKGPFEAINTKAQELTVLCKRKEDVKDQEYKKVAKQGLTLRVDTKLSDEKRNRILELRQQRIQGMTLQQGSSASGFVQPTAIPTITTLPSSIPTLSVPLIPQPTSPFLQLPTQPQPRRRYCLIVEEELSAREEEEIGLQSSKKRVKKSSNPQEEKELLGMLRRMIELEE